MSRKQTSKVPPCSDVRHATARVVRWGRYGGRAQTTRRAGRNTRIRQRYRCVPRRGKGSPHTFTEPLPRLLPAPGQPRTCARCKQEIDPTAAPVAPRKHSYTLAEMARALFLCGSGWSYRSASQRLRRDAQLRRAGSTDDREFGLAADWVELFAPMLGEHLLPQRWPVDAVVLDSVPLALAGALNPKGFPQRGGVAAWTIMVAAGYTGHTFKICRLRAVPGSPDRRDWAEFLLSVPGQPARVISDIDKAIERGVEIAWPSVLHVRAFDKLQRRLRRGRRQRDQAGQAPLADGPDLDRRRRRVRRSRRVAEVRALGAQAQEQQAPSAGDARLDQAPRETRAPTAPTRLALPRRYRSA